MSKRRAPTKNWMDTATPAELLVVAANLQMDARRTYARARSYREESPTLAIQAQQAAARSAAQSRTAYRLATGGAA